MDGDRTTVTVRWVWAYGGGTHFSRWADPCLRGGIATNLPVHLAQRQGCGVRAAGYSTSAGTTPASRRAARAAVASAVASVCAWLRDSSAMPAP